MTYDTRTDSFVVPSESMRLAEDQLRRLNSQVKPEHQQQLDISEASILKALEYVGLYSGQHKVLELDVRER